MASCPSSAAEKYTESQELPERCPECSKDNADPVGNWVLPGHEPFCSLACEKSYLLAQMAADEDAAQALEDQEREYNHMIRDSLRGL